LEKDKKSACNRGEGKKKLKETSIFRASLKSQNTSIKLQINYKISNTKFQENAVLPCFGDLNFGIWILFGFCFFEI
jgi:hypothetical protein